MMASTDRIAALNNEGCKELDAGRLETAMTHFKTALSFLKDYLQNRPPQDTRENQEDEGSWPSSSQLRPMPFDMLHKNHAVDTNSTSRRAWAQTRCSSSAVYSNAIRMIPGYFFSNDAIEDNRVKTALIVFNLATTLHVQGLRGSCSRGKPLQKAHSLYSYTFDLVGPIVNEHYQRAMSTGNAAFDLLVVSLLNNVAHLQMEFSEFETASSTFQSLVQYATFSSSFRDLQEQRYNNNISSTTSSPDAPPQQEENATILEQVDCMIHNASVMGLSSHNAAPAA